MGKAKNWTSEEAEAASKACAVATHDSVKGSGQRREDFAMKVHLEFASLTPAGVAGTGTFTDRDPDGSLGKAWNYVRDTVLKEVQKFNGTLNIVLHLGLSGVTHQQKVNIAVAVFLKKLKHGQTHYEYRDFDPNTWRLCKS